MNRWILPVAVIGAVGLATTAGGLTGAQVPPQQQQITTAARVSLVCPVFSSVTADLRVAAATSGTGLRTTPVSKATSSPDAGAFTVVKAPAEPLRVSAMLPDPFGASSFSSADAGPQRGISTAGCASARTENWFAGVDVSASAQADLTVVNLDPSAASVDIEVFGEDGPTAGPRGLEVSGNSAKAVSLSGLPRGGRPVAIRVSSGDGRFAAFLRQRSWTGEDSLGGDWLAAAAAPATEQVIPGLAEGAGLRRLVVTNPGERTTTVSIGFLASSGPGTIPGAEQLEVPPGTTRNIDLTTGLSGQAVTLTLASDQPVTAAVLQDTGSSLAVHDPAFAVATPALPSDSLWPLAAGKKVASTLVLANPGTVDAAVSVAIGENPTEAVAQQVNVPAGSQQTVPLPAGATSSVRVQTQAGGIRAALVSTRKLGKVRGLAVWPLADQDGGASSSTVVFEPRLGG